MNDILFQLLEGNRTVFAVFAIVGGLSFLFYTFRGDDRESNTFRYVIPVVLWMIAENVIKALGYTIPQKWNRLACGVCFLMIGIMIVVSLKKDLSIWAVFNIIGNLFVMYAVPSVIYLIITTAVIVGGGAIALIVGIPMMAIMAALAPDRYTYYDPKEVEKTIDEMKWRL